MLCANSRFTFGESQTATLGRRTVREMMTFHPTAADPAIVTASDATLFACWLEQIHDRWLWIFMNTAKMNYVGPPYNGDDSL